MVQSGNQISSVATGTVTTSGGITATAGQSIIGSGLVIGCTVATASVPGCIAATNWNTFNNKVGTSTVPTIGDLAFWTGTFPPTVGDVATSSISLSAGFSNTGTLGATVGGSASTISQIEHRSFTYSTSTAWAGTTTITLESGYNEVWNNAVCYTDTGTLNVQFGYGTASTTLFNASTTNGTETLTPNNTMTAANKVKVDIGTPASSPTTINCTVRDTI